jgi:hypothetical protein
MRSVIVCTFHEVRRAGNVAKSEGKTYLENIRVDGRVILSRF